MKKTKSYILAAALSAAAILPSQLQAQNAYYFPKATGTFDQKIPEPKAFLGYDIGSFYTRHDQIIAYFKELAKVSDKITYQEIGRSYENRPLGVAIITSAKNQANLAEIQKRHNAQKDPKAASLDAGKDPVVVFLDYSVHGGEVSSGEASLLNAYYLLANKSEEVDKFLDQAIIIMDISQNPDGRDRAVNYLNSFSNQPSILDANDREHNEPFPGGRPNHYYTDLNRDWLAASQIETRPKIKFFHTWYPNVHIDFHEMGKNSTYYFEPSPKSMESPLLPKSSFEFNRVLANYHKDALDGIGSLYFTKELFDNFSPIYGSTYPDFHGAVGVTVEQAGSRGILQETDNGPLAFKFTVRNQLTTGIASIRGAVAEKEGLFKLQKDFFKSALTQAAAHAKKAFVFGDDKDQSLTKKLLDLVLLHNIDVYKLPSDITIDGKSFKKEQAYVVPAQQTQFRMVHAIFEETPPVTDSVFYSGTSYAIAHAYGLQYAKAKAAVSLGEKITASPLFTSKNAIGKAAYAYLVNWTEYNAGRIIPRLLAKGIIVKAAFKPFTSTTNIGDVDYGHGTLIIPVEGQPLDADQLYAAVVQAADEAEVSIQHTATGFAVKGIDLGSPNVHRVADPKVAFVLGQGVNSAEIGQVWYLFTEHLQQPATKIEPAQLPKINLSNYNTLILVSGQYDWSKETVADLKSWVARGGNLITIKGATEWAIKNQLTTEKLYVDTAFLKKEYARTNFDQRLEALSPARMSGNIFQADIDITNPIGFGLKTRDLFVNVEGQVILQPSKDRFSTVAQFTKAPYVSGYIAADRLKPYANKAAIVTSAVGSGSVILFAEDPAHRKYWHGTDRLLINAVYFGKFTNPAASR